MHKKDDWWIFFGRIWIRVIFEGRIRKENNLDPHHCSKVSGQVVKMDGEEKGPFLLPFLSFASILTIFSIYVLSFSLFLPGDGEGNTPSKYRLFLLL